jgi:xanthine dehydrogenase accessory factor
VPGEAGGWLEPLTSWPAALCAWLERDAAPVVRVLVADSRGSAPREPGACMLVAAGGAAGTIGGGHLEWHAMRCARALLADPLPGLPVRLAHLVLGTELAQCCGGTVQLWLERFTRADLPQLRTAVELLEHGTAVLITTDLTHESVARRLRAARDGERMQFNSGEHTRLIERLEPAAPLWLYGAGHVGQALVSILAGLPFEITWVDARAGMFPQPLPSHVHTVCAADPVETVRRAPAHARFLVMTHEHALDYALCRAILTRGAGMPDCAWLGLIGSKSKAARFRSRLKRDGLTPGQIARLTCPIGLTAIRDKLPAAIAVGIAAQLLTDTGTGRDLTAAHGTADAPEPCGAPACSGCAPARASADRSQHRDA